MSKTTLNIKCILCGKVYSIEVDELAYLKYMKGKANIQEAFPDLSADDRELIISNICGNCFDNVFAEDDEYEEDEEDGFVGHDFDRLDH